MHIATSKSPHLFTLIALRDPSAPLKFLAIPSRAAYSRSAACQPQFSSDQLLSAFLSQLFQVFHANFNTL